jgi:alpha-L-rhamnosidase
MPKDTYGDWCVPPESPKLIHSEDPARKTDGVLLGTAYYYELLKRMESYAHLLGKTDDAEGFGKLAGVVQTAFQLKFFHAATGFYSNGTQTSSIVPLAFGMTPNANKATVFQSLIAKIDGESKGHVGTGLVGAQWLMRTLTENGRGDVALEIATQKTYPGWGYMIEKGATTVWELWNGDTADPAMNSGNHVMQIGDLGIWMYEYLAGISPDEAKPGFQHVIIRPYPVAGLSFVKASHQSPYGLIRSEWKRTGTGIEMGVTIPPNATATVYVPGEATPHEFGSGTYKLRR